MPIDPHEKKRQDYNPKIVNILFIGESRPNGGTFFYNEDSKLFIYTKKAFDEVFQNNFDCKKFKEMNCWLYDVCNIPVNNFNNPERTQHILNGIPGLLNTIKILNPRIIIVVKRGDFRDRLLEPLQNIGFEENDRAFFLPFPSNGWQNIYVKKLIKIISDHKNLFQIETGDDTNEFLELINQKLCVKTCCTTCGNMPFRKECLRLGPRLYESMMKLEENQISELNNYLESVNIAFRCIRDLDKREKLVRHWPNVFKTLMDDLSYEYRGIILTGYFQEFNDT
ncbi:MAG: hypothetical protein WC677_05590 [Clostridia bacterium]|jgi:hypothetical protein